MKNLLLDINPSPDIIFGGDFNLPNAEWPYGTPSPKCPPDERTMLYTLNEFCNDLCMSQYVQNPTHKDGNILDLVFTNNVNFIHDCVTIPFLQSTSHHHIVMVTTPYKVKIHPIKDEEKTQQNMFNSLNFFSKEVDWEKINTSLSEIKWEDELKGEEPNTILDKIYVTVFSICERYVPRKKKKNKKDKSKAVRFRNSLIKRRRKLTKRLLTVHTQTRISKIKYELIEIEKKLQKSFQNSISHMEERAVEAIRSNPKYFFSYVKTKTKVKTSVGPLYNPKGVLTNSNREMAEILSEQYVKVFSKPTDKKVIEGLKSAENFNAIPPIQISVERFVEVINELSPSAAPGPDGFPAILLKKCKAAISEPLVLLWRCSMEKCMVPDSLKKSIITPIHKGGSRSAAANYRPIALTSHIIKVFEKIVRQHIVQHMMDHNLFNRNQHGFTPGRSCLSQLLEQFDLILDINDDNAKC